MSLRTSITTAIADFVQAVDGLQRMSVKLRRMVVSRDALLSEQEVIELLGIGRAPGHDLLVALGIALPLRLKEVDPSRKRDVERILWGDVLDALRNRAQPGAPRRQRQKPRAVPRGREW